MGLLKFGKGVKLSVLALSSMAFCSPSWAEEEGHKPYAITFLGQQVIPHGTRYKNTVVGGLSSLDYNPETNKFIAICDDRSKKSPARFYELNLDYDLKGFHKVHLSAVHYIKQPDGSLYPKPGFLGKSQIDPEALRFSSTRQSYLWSSEGHVKYGVNPTVQEMTRDGRFIRNFTLPAKYRVDADNKHGVRDNLVFEGLTLATDKKSIIVATEGPLYQDGEEADIKKGAMIRLLQMDLTSGQAIHEFAYPIDPVHKETLLFGNFSVNGVVDILAVKGTEYIIVERSFSTGAGLSVRLYLADIAEASDVLALDSLKEALYRPVKKTLLLDLAETGISIDNIEGISFGPRLKDGRQSLLLISDNNFRSSQVTQILAFALSGLE